MEMSNYPNGFEGGVSLRGMPVLSSHAGNVFWVDSVDGSNGNKGTFKRPFATIDYAVGRCTANNGDIIMAKPGHVETVIAAAGLDLDVAGITIVFMGNDNDRAKVSFTTAVSADMDVDAADITLINPRFVAGINALTGPIDVNAARFTIINGLYEDGTAIDTTDCIVADANADDMLIDGWLYRAGTEAGTQKQSNIQIAAATRPILKNVRITGNFATGVIENGAAWIDAYLENVVIDNANTSPTVAVLLQATSTGAMKNCFFRVASGTTYLTVSNTMQFFECFGTGTDATAGEKIGTILAGDIEGKIDVVDGYFDVPTPDGAANTTVRDVVGNKTDAAATGAVSAVESIMAYVKQTVTELQVVDGYFDVPTADATTDTTMRDVVGRKTDASVYVPGTQKSIAAYVKGIANLQARVAMKSEAVMVDNDVLFTITGGPILVDALWSECATANDATASTLAYKSTPTAGSEQTLSAASASLGAAGIGDSVSLIGTTLATAALLNANGANLGMTNPLIVPAGNIGIDIAVGSTTGTWRHYIRYRPLAVGVTVA